MADEPKSKWLIDNIAETSKSARNIFLLYIGFIAYCILAILSATDRKIILNDTTHLPIINIDVSIYSFFIVAPILAIIIFTYLQLYIHWLNELKIDFNKNDDPKTNDDSKTKHRFYPWILNFTDDHEKGFVTFIQKFMISFAIWWVLPLVLMLFPLGIIRKHNLFLSIITGFFPIISIIMILLFWATSGIKAKRNFGKVTLIFIVIVFSAFYFLFMIPWSAAGNHTGILNRLLYVDLSYQKLISEQDEEYKTLSWGNLYQNHLEGANLTGSILKKVDMRKANLLNANIYGADLRGARLNNAILQGANLRYCLLDQDSLSYTNLVNSSLSNARTRDADFTCADLSGATIIAGKFQHAIFRGAIFYGTNLYYSRLDSSNLFQANLDSSNLTGATLIHARLVKASLRKALLDSTNMLEANLEGADLAEASFIDVRNLTKEQLSKVKSLYNVKGLDSNLTRIIKEDYPNLFNKP